MTVKPKPTALPHQTEMPGPEDGPAGHRASSGGGRAPEPKLRLEIRDLTRPGAAEFLGAVNAGTLLASAVARVRAWLYAAAAGEGEEAPATRSVTVVLRDMGGVAYTVGSELDRDHKEIHVSLGYVAAVRPAARRAAEIEGVLVHELVHCYQWDGLGTCPGGLVEGVADWVRLRCGLAPPHWRRETGGRWDSGYERTAYFLEYLGDRFGEGSVRRINGALRERYEEGEFWAGLFGRSVEQLWGDYVKAVEREGEGSGGQGGGDDAGGQVRVSED